MNHLTAKLRLLALAAGCWAAPLVWGFYPEPGNIYYGIVRDTNGRQMNSGDGVRLLMQTSRTNVVNGRPQVDVYTVAECEVISSPVGRANFILRPSLDGGGQNRYSPLAVRQGEQVRVLLVRAGTTNELAGAVAPVATRGTIQPTNLAAQCVDVDQDQLCDQWELDNFGTLQFTDGTTDFDEDGFTEKQEHDGGTIPTNPNDPPVAPLILRPIVVTETGITVEWRRVPGRTYQLQSSSNLNAGFAPVPPGIIVGDPNQPGNVEIKTGGQSQLFLRVREQ
jgi:hypothetical protein